MNTRQTPEYLTGLVRELCKLTGEVELFQLPAPLFEVPPDFTRTVLFAHKELKDMSKEERMRACYLHSCLCYVTRKQMTNTTLRKRFGISDKNSAEASRLLRETIGAGLIEIQDPDVGMRRRSYLPFWAAQYYRTKGGIV